LDEKGQLAWSPDKDKWELYDLNEGGTQAIDLADTMPEKLTEMKDLFTMEFAKNNGFSVGGGLFVPVVRPDLRLSTPYTEWTFAGNMTRMPGFTAPALGNRRTWIRSTPTFPPTPTACCTRREGFPVAFPFMSRMASCPTSTTCSRLSEGYQGEKPVPNGKVKIEVETGYAVKKPGGPLDVRLAVNGKERARGQVPISAPLFFTENDCLDAGTDLGSPVSVPYYDKAPFPFNGKIAEVRVKYLGSIAEVKEEKQQIDTPASSEGLTRAVFRTWAFAGQARSARDCVGVDATLGS
jgi:hypothetical protein